MNYILPEGDDKLRWVCSKCHYIHYETPRIIVGTCPIKDGKILLCKRAIEPRNGKWTLPSGFMENNETVEEGAIRETLEETGIDVTIKQLMVVYSIPRISQVYMLFLADYSNTLQEPGPETECMDFFDWQDIPWNELAFSAVDFALKHYNDGHFNSEIGHGVHNWT